MKDGRASWIILIYLIFIYIAAKYTVVQCISIIMFYTFSTILVSQYKTLEYNSYINLCFQYINNELNVTNTRLLH